MSGSAITPFAWVFMLTSMGAVTVLAAYCYYRILFAPSRDGSDGETAGGEGVRTDVVS